jgi:hypothetical protein
VVIESEDPCDWANRPGTAELFIRLIGCSGRILKNFSRVPGTSWMFEMGELRNKVRDFLIGEASDRKALYLLFLPDTLNDNDDNDF